MFFSSKKHYKKMVSLPGATNPVQALALSADAHSWWYV